MHVFDSPPPLPHTALFVRPYPWKEYDPSLIHPTTRIPFTACGAYTTSMLCTSMLASEAPALLSPPSRNNHLSDDYRSGPFSRFSLADIFPNSQKNTHPSRDSPVHPLIWHFALALACDTPGAHIMMPPRTLLFLRIPPTYDNLWPKNNSAKFKISIFPLGLPSLSRRLIVYQP
jgi:hypothetical protein